MNRTVTSLVAFGIGAAALGMAQRNNLMSKRNMKQIRKKITKAMF